ncbi:MAG: nickel pincer cofactor biosynthesis protein LarC [Planctomycetota bacterium]|nr:nickel pincer cofactor biosynthesis protein LarC [Planctomycetota bacterium]
MRIAYLDCPSGVAGDMWVGAMLDAGLEIEPLVAAIDSMGLPGVALDVEPVLRSGIGGSLFKVKIPPGDKPHRHLADVLKMTGCADVPDKVKQRVEAVFMAIAKVEAEVHRQSIEAVHFHEVGAEDAIVDVVCACLGVHLLGLEKIYSSAVAVGSGSVRCDHGVMPVPAPGALANLFGIPVRSGSLTGERTTPTGAALLKVLVDEFEPALVWTPTATGYGAGTRDDPDHPNLLRLTLGESCESGPSSEIFEVTCNLDTATGEQIGYLLDGLLVRGAVDAFATAVQMKKGRPGYQLTALVESEMREDVTQFLLEESTSLGVRMHRVMREVLERWSEVVDTDLGPVRHKIARLPSGSVVRRPEDDEIKRLVEEKGLTRSEVLDRIGRARP